MRTLVWFRGKDLRIADNLALSEAARDEHLIPLFFAGAELEHGAHRTQFALESVAALAKNLEQHGSGLVGARGDALTVLPELVRRWKVDRVLSLRRTEPKAREEATALESVLGVPLTLLDGETLAPPETIRTLNGGPFAVFTPFARRFRESLGDISAPTNPPKKLPPLPEGARRDGVALPSASDLGITPSEGVLKGGERAARDRLKEFFEERAAAYPTLRDRLDLEGTSRFSADLRAGLLSARTIWHAAERALARSPKALTVFTNELIWREFAHSLLWDRPTLASEPFRPEFADFPWENSEKAFNAWCQGKTGYPVVDASARQLLETGFVHNRARMISASFLSKHLFVDYRWGERHYYAQLTDGDQAQNNTGWQWSAGCGIDAQPYFRVFNPTIQGKKFDQNGDYVRRWVPELARLPTRYIHAPASAPESVLGDAGITLDRDYPRPIVDHAEARGRFLAVASTVMAKG